MSELTRRILFALIAAPLGILAIYVGDAPLAALLAVIAGLGAWEFCRIARAAGADPLDTVAICVSALVPLLMLGTHTGKLSIPLYRVPALVAVAFLVVFAAVIFVRGPERRPLLSAATTMFGIAYTAMIGYVFVIRHHDFVITAAGGTALVMLPIVLTWATDIGAYFVGRTVGGPKLIPHVSPGKTIAGAVGGMAVAIGICWIYTTYVLEPFASLTFSAIGVVLFAVLISAIAQIGDLAESLIKREAGVKDSSTIIPGHGGILDRFDSLLFVLPASTFLLRWLLIIAPSSLPK